MNKFKIYYRKVKVWDSLISDEIILRRYWDFLNHNEDERLEVCLHSGSMCFDMMALVWMIIMGIREDKISNEEILGELKTGDMVIIGNKRARWLGLYEENGERWVRYEEDGMGRNGKMITQQKYQSLKGNIRPYHGKSERTGGTGVRTVGSAERAEFLAKVLDIDGDEIPVSFNFRILVQMERSYFEDIIEHTVIEYENQKIALLDLGLPISYVKRNGVMEQFGQNAAKTKPNIIFAERIDNIRDLIFDHHGCYTLITKAPAESEGFSQVDDVLALSLTRKTLVSINISSSLAEHIVENETDAKYFAMTDKFITDDELALQQNNELTRKLNRQLKNIAQGNIQTVEIEGAISRNEYDELKKKIRFLKGEFSEKKDFQRNALGLVNLFTTAVFSMNDLAEAIDKRRVSVTVRTAEERLDELDELAEAGGGEDYDWIAKTLREIYAKLLQENTKQEMLEKIMMENRKKRVLVLMPKKYYVDIANFLYKEQKDRKSEGREIRRWLKFSTIDNVDNDKTYNLVIAVCALQGKKFKFSNIAMADKAVALLYDCEKKRYEIERKIESMRNRKIEAKVERKTNIKYDEVKKNTLSVEEIKDLDEIRDFEDFTNELALAEISKVANRMAKRNYNALKTEVSYAGKFETGEMIFFSPNYAAVVYDNEKKIVVEKHIKDIVEGDELVFVKHNEFTKNIVDFLFEYLLSEGMYSNEMEEIYQKSRRWKEVLYEYKIKNHLTCAKIAKELGKMHCTITSNTVRQWLDDGSKIVGPREMYTMYAIAKMVKDEDMVKYTTIYFDACKTVRRERIKILELIAQILNQRLSGIRQESNSVLKLVENSIEEFSEILRVEQIVELDEPLMLSRNVVNKPIDEV